MSADGQLGIKSLFLIGCHVDCTALVLNDVPVQLFNDSTASTVHGF
jgi:hypothetical protein